MRSRNLRSATSTTGAPLPLSNPSPTFYVTDFGAVADGVKDCRAAVQAAFDAAGAAGGGTVLIPDGPLIIALNGVDGDGLWVSANTVIRGEGLRSEIRATSVNSNFHAVFHLGGNNIHFESVKLTRASDMYGTMINLRACSNVWLYEVTLNGNKTSYGVNGFHGMILSGDAGDKMNNFNLVRSRFTDCDYVIFEGETTAIAIDGVLVHSCEFWKNRATDLEFNSPAGSCVNVTVTRSHFHDNLSATAAAGFAIGFANVQNIVISWCSFRKYPINPIHFENASSNARVTRCWFETFSTGAAVQGQYKFTAAIVIFGGNTIAPHEITIDNCRFDTTKQTTSTWCIYMGQAGATYAPYTITAINNVYVINPNAADDSKNSTPYYQEQLSGLVLSPNATMTASP